MVRPLAAAQEQIAGSRRIALDETKIKRACGSRNRSRECGAVENWIRAANYWPRRSRTYAAPVGAAPQGMTAQAVFVCSALDQLLGIRRRVRIVKRSNDFGGIGC